VRSRAQGRAALLPAIFALLLFACSQPAAPPPPAAPAQVAAQPGPRVTFPDGFVVHLEVAADDPTREQGLMYRDTLPDDRGMIFLFPTPGVYPFWMKNTLIPLDMYWIDDARRVVTVASDVPPCKADPCASYPAAGPGPARYVLETAAGVAKKHHVEPGTVVRIDGIDSVTVR